MVAVPAILANSGTYRPGAISPGGDGGRFDDIFAAAQNSGNYNQYSAMPKDNFSILPTMNDGRVNLEDTGSNPASNPLVAFFQHLREQNLNADSLQLSPENKARLEELMLNSGYTNKEIDELLTLSRQKDGSINLLALAQAVLASPPLGGQALALNQTDRPLFAQAMQDLGIASNEIENYLNSAPRQGDEYLLRDIASLLANARINPQVGEEGTVDRSNLQDLLQKLGLSKQEIEALLNNSADGKSQGANAKEMFALLQAAANKQDQGIAQALRDMAQRSQQGSEEQNDAQRLQAQMIKAQQKIEAKVAQQMDGETVQATNPKEQPAAVAKTAPAEAGVDNKLTEAAKALVESAAKTQSGDLAHHNGKSSQHDKSSPHAKEVAEQLNALNRSGKDAAKVAPQENSLTSMLNANATGPVGTTANLLPAYLVRQVAFNMAQMASKQQNTLRLELKPPTLGELSMELTVKDGAVKASLVAHTVAARKALEAGMEQLKQQLTQQGLRVEQIDISVHPDVQKRHEQANARQHSQQRARQDEKNDDSEAKPVLGRSANQLSVVA